jgi:hypothetical protein
LRPKVIYCASGGCLAAWLATMSSFTKSIERWPITSALFIDKSIPFTPRMISLIANGFFYKRAEIEKYVSDIFVPCKLQDVEIITGYYTMSDANSPRTHGQCIYISSNFPQERSAIKDFTPIIECVKVDFASKSISDMTDEEMDQHLTLVSLLLIQAQLLKHNWINAFISVQLILKEITKKDYMQ